MIELFCIRICPG